MFCVEYKRTFYFYFFYSGKFNLFLIMSKIIVGVHIASVIIFTKFLTILM